MDSVNPIAKARPWQKPTVTLTSVSIPVFERKWIDIETQRSHDQKCYRVSKPVTPLLWKAITRLLRHDQTVHRERLTEWHHRRAQEAEVRRRFAMVTWRLEIKTGKRRRSEEKISMLRESKLFQSTRVPWSNSRTLRRTCVARQYTVTERIYRVPLPRLEREWIEFYN